MTLTERINRSAGETPAPSTERRQARWVRIREERLEQREREGKSRHEAVWASTDTSVAL